MPSIAVTSSRVTQRPASGPKEENDAAHSSPIAASFHFRASSITHKIGHHSKCGRGEFCQQGAEDINSACDISVPEASALIIATWVDSMAPTPQLKSESGHDFTKAGDASLLCLHMEPTRAMVPQTNIEHRLEPSAIPVSEKES